MDTASEILVIIVSVLLSLVLILGIAVLVIVLKVLASVKRVVAKAETLADSATHVGHMLEDATGKMAVIKIIRNVLKMAKGK